MAAVLDDRFASNSVIQLVLGNKGQPKAPADETGRNPSSHLRQPMAPRLTIAIPTVNRAEFLGRAIESALAQTSQDIEILVSDNGSTDDTPSVIARYAERGIRTFRHDSTMSAAKHGGFLRDQARGEFFLGLSDDDFLEPEFAAEVLAMFDLLPEVAFVYTGCSIHYDELQVPAAVGPPIESGTDFLVSHFSDQREICWCACVTRLNDLREVGPQPDDRVFGDMFFWTKLALRGPVGCVPRVLSHYILFRSKNDNISHCTQPPAWAREARLLADEVIEGFRRNGDVPPGFAALAKHHIARSTANQFVWTRVKGADVFEAWRWAAECLPFLDGSFATITRLCAALLVPRRVLKRLMLGGVARLATSRSNNLHSQRFAECR